MMKGTLKVDIEAMDACLRIRLMLSVRRQLDPIWQILGKKVKQLVKVEDCSSILLGNADGITYFCLLCVYFNL